MGLACGEPTKHVRDRDPHMSDTRAAASLARLDGNDVVVIHGGEFSIIRGSAQQCFAGHFGPTKENLPASPPLRHRFPRSLNGLGEG